VIILVLYLSVTGWLQAISPDKDAVMTGGDNVVNIWKLYDDPTPQAQIDQVGV